MSSLSLGKEEALADIRSALAEFSRLTVVLEKSTAKDASDALQALPTRLQVISSAMRSLESQYQETFVKISRSLRALQHRIETVENDIKRSNSDRGTAEWSGALNQWLLALVPFISDVLAPESAVCNRDARRFTFLTYTRFLQAEVPVKYQVDLAVISIQAAIDLSKRILSVTDFTSHEISLDTLDQARTTVSNCRTSFDDKAEWLVLLSASFYNRGVTLYLAELPVPALVFIERSVHIAQELLHGQGTESQPSSETVAVLAELGLQYSKRLELLAACHIKRGKQLASLLMFASRSRF